jgi:fumarylpyruvate hydrolase
MMKSYVFDPPIPATVAVAGEPGRFPVRRIFCVGRNYAAYAPLRAGLSISRD